MKRDYGKMNKTYDIPKNNFLSVEEIKGKYHYLSAGHRDRKAPPPAKIKSTKITKELTAEKFSLLRLNTSKFTSQKRGIISNGIVTISIIFLLAFFMGYAYNPGGFISERYVYDQEGRLKCKIAPDGQKEVKLWSAVSVTLLALTGSRHSNNTIQP
ncbi:MAG: hypothetical protein AB1422_01380 [bacterium]